MTSDNLHPEKNPDEGKPNPEESTFIGSSPFNIEMIDRARDLLASPPEQIGPYRILERIGGGGMGEVFRAEQREPIRRQVAIKIIKLGMDTKAVIARFEAERQALALMDHPHIAKVFDAAAEETGRPYFVMEYVKGKPITDYADQNHLTIPERLELFEQVCQAIQHAHHKGIIHRDMKPSNVLVSTHDGKPFAKVIDFGIAKAVAQQLTDKTLFTQHDQFIGTPQYMSPEQAEGSLDIDTRTDVYSLGVLLYELLTGSTPFSSAELRAVAFEQIKKLIVEVDPPKPSTRLSQSEQTLPTLAAFRRTEPKRLGMLVTGELDWIVMKALEKDRKRRYDTPAAFAQDILAHLHGEAVQAAPPSSFYQLRKFMRKHRGPVIGAAAVGSTLAVGIIGTSWGYYRANHFAHQEYEARLEATAAKDAATTARDAEREQREKVEFLAYKLSLQSAQNAIENETWPLARERLSYCQEQHRGWEWTFLKKLADSVILRMPGTVLGFSSADRLVLVNGFETQVFTREGKPYSNPITLEGESSAREGIYPVASLSPDGKFILAVGTNGSMRLWTLQGEPLGESFKHGDRPLNISFSTKGDSFASFSTSESSQNHQVKLWTMEGKPAYAPLDHESQIIDVDFFDHDRRMLTITYTGLARIWQLNKRIEPEILEYEGDFVSAEVNKMGTALLTISDSPSPNDQVSIRNAVVWEIDKDGSIGKPKRIFTYEKQVSWVNDKSGLGMRIDKRDNSHKIGFTRDGLHIFYPISNGVTGLLNLDGTVFKNDFKPLTFVEGSIVEPIDVQDGEYTLLSSGKLEVGLWKSDGSISGKAYVPFVKNYMYSDAYASMSPDGQIIVVNRSVLLDANHLSPAIEVVSSKTEELFNLEIQAIREEDSLAESTLDINSQFAGSPSWIMEIDTNKRLQILDRISHEPIDHPDWGFDKVHATAVSPDGTRLFVADNSRVHVLETKQWTLMASLQVDLNNKYFTGSTLINVQSLEFTSSGKRLIIQHSDSSATVFDIRPFEEQKRSWHHRQLDSIASEAYYREMCDSIPLCEDRRTAILSSKTLRSHFKRLLLEKINQDIHSRRTKLINPRYLSGEGNVVVSRTSVADKSLFLVDPVGFEKRMSSLLANPKTQMLADKLLLTTKGWIPTAEDWNQAAMDYVFDPELSREDYQKALIAAKNAMEKDPSSWRILFTAGLAYYRTTEYQKSEQVLEEALILANKANDWDPNASAVLSMAQFQLGKVADAKETFARVRARISLPEVHFWEVELPLYKEAEALIDPLAEPAK